jgi:hypothetical protein
VGQNGCLAAVDPGFLSMDLVLDPDLNCQNAEIQQALDYWRAIRGLRTMPALDDMDVLQIPRNVLAHITLVDIEYEPKMRFRWRLIGTAVTTILQRDMTGRYWDEIYSEDVFNLFAEPTNYVLQNRKPMRFTAKAHVADREFYDAEHIYMPLSGPDSRIERMLGVSAFTYSSENGED